MVPCHTQCFFLYFTKYLKPLCQPKKVCSLFKAPYKRNILNRFLYRFKNSVSSLSHKANMNGAKKDGQSNFSLRKSSSFCTARPR